MAYLQDELDAKTVAAEAARAAADAARVEASTARSNADTASAASAQASASAATAKTEATAKRDDLIGDLTGTDKTKATLLADAAIVGAGVIDVRSRIAADTDKGACAAAFTAMDVASTEGHCESSVVSSSRRKVSRRRLAQTSAYDVSVLLSAARTNQTLIDAAVRNLASAVGVSNVANVTVDPVLVIRAIPGVKADAVDTFASAATASTAAATNATALQREAAALAETAAARETEASSLASNAGTLELDLETTRTQLDEANAAASVPDTAETNVTLIAAAAAGAVAFLAIAFVAYRFRGCLGLRRNSQGGSQPPRFDGSGRGRNDGFGGFGASRASRNDIAPAGAEVSTPVPPPAGARYAAHLQPSQGTPVSPTERGWADFPPGSPQPPAAALAAAQTPPSSFQPRWTSAPTPTPMQGQTPVHGHTPVHGQTAVQGQAPIQASFQAPASPFQQSPFPTPNQNEATPGYSPSAAFASFGAGTPGGPSAPPTETRHAPHSARSVVSSPFSPDPDSVATPASQTASPSLAFAGFAHRNQVTAVETALPAARALNPFLAAGTAVMLSNSFRTPAPVSHSGGAVFASGSDAESDDPFGDAGDDSDDDPFGNVDDSDADA